MPHESLVDCEDRRSNAISPHLNMYSTARTAKSATKLKLKLGSYLLRERTRPPTVSDEWFTDDRLISYDLQQKCKIATGNFPLNLRCIHGGGHPNIIYLLLQPFSWHGSTEIVAADNEQWHSNRIWLWSSWTLNNFTYAFIPCSADTNISFTFLPTSYPNGNFCFHRHSR